jgi:type I restriction enzyme S subunit
MSMNSIGIWKKTIAWEQRRLGDYCDMFNGDRGINYPNADDMVAEGMPFINAGDLQNGRVNLGTANKITRAKYNQLGGAKIQLGDIVYCLRGTLGKNAFISNFNEGTVASSLVVIRPKGIDGRYLFQVLNSDVEYRQRTLCDEGAAQPNLSARNLGGFTIPMPSMSEQNSISAFLDALDHLITLHQRELGKLQNMKKALLCKMFV